MASIKDDRLELCSASLFDEMQVRLFDAMDQLSHLRIDTPQLVVVGSQSSGKSSVLEALVRFHFPVDSTKPTTRFPIKLVLRKGDKEMTRVRIDPETSRSAEDKSRFLRLGEELSGDRFDRIIEKAKSALRVRPSHTQDDDEGPSGTFCGDVLVIERHGPSLPKLDLVDLPGLFDAASTGQSLEDKELVNNMVSKYIRSPMNIILLVVSAEVKDYSNVPALGKLQQMLAEDATLKKRVVCVLTRPDEAGSLPETFRVLGAESPFAQTFARPWHVLRNQNQEARRKQQSLDERDRIENDFFRQSNWQAVPSTQKGIGALRQTLKSMIWTHTHIQLPNVISVVSAGIAVAEAQLNSALVERATPKGRRDYLSDVAERFAHLTREAALGTFRNQQCRREHRNDEPCQDCEGFFDPYGCNELESQQKRLRANVRALNRAFAAAMRRYGRSTTAADQPTDQLAQQNGPGAQDFHLQRLAEYYKHKAPELQSRKEYERFVRENNDRWRAMGPGREASDGAYWGLFAHQAKKWKHIATRHVDAVWKVVGEFFDLALTASCPDQDVLTELRRQLVNPNLERLQVKADQALRDIVRCHAEPNPGFYDSLADARAVREHAEALLKRLATMRPEPREKAEVNDQVTPPITEQVNGQQDAGTQQTNNAVRQKIEAKSSQHGTPQRNTEPKASAKDPGMKEREAMLAFALDNTIAMLGSYNPLLSHPVVRKSVVPLIARQISAAFEPSSETSTKDKSTKRAETSFSRTVHDLLPPQAEDPAAANVIAQVELHYEAIQTAFVGYVASLVVEQRILGQLPDAVFNEKIVRGMSDEDVNKIAGEKPNDAEKRNAIDRDLKTLRVVLKTMQEYQNASQPAP
ncbi:P-loop containing nucleoside triphosphate hydrolase protein [Achaetomium macrosporum]|uniref:P-loop containing nucleoside triphosphate hydrolase protein n=1 Tax=Achaetomium macrosporum TaxID=79813 RepID=A0AAN7C149_9PEZI|nr:P-loop containing nucleoside triphosphate hydrolase protein [Achaetomium macrosporum]